MSLPLPIERLRPGGARWGACVVALALGLFTGRACAQTVATLAGGRLTVDGPDSGFADGDTQQESQFRHPLGCLWAPAGVLLVADSGNGAVRKLDLGSQETTTIIRNLRQPVGLAFDLANNLYVLDQDSGRVLKYDRFDTLYSSPVALATGLAQPTALVFDLNNQLIVTELAGNVKRVNPANGNVTLVASGLNQPRGVTVLDDGSLVVSDTGAHVLRYLNATTGARLRQVGTGVAGYRDGTSSQAQFNQPWQLAKAPNGTIVVADRMNHRVRLVDTTGPVLTLYGVFPYAAAEPCLNCEPVILPGWLDGSADVAEAREPVGVTVASDGTVYAAEDYYHLLRQITDTGLGSTGGGGGGGGTTNTNIVVLAPIVVPLSGYYPLGVDVTVSDPNAGELAGSRVYYTTDGSDPGPDNAKSQLVPMTNQVGVIPWRDPTRDLSSLRVQAFVSGQASTLVSGRKASRNELGVPSNLNAGQGATLVVPVVANLKPGQVLKSLQYLVEVEALDGAPPLTAPLKGLTMSANDFVPQVIACTNAPIARSEIVGNVARLQVAFVGTNAAFNVNNFATVGMLAVPLPASSRSVDLYAISVSEISGTSDGFQARVDLVAQPLRIITMARTSYLVGDTSAGGWYNAGLFGDGLLENSDVNNVFYASLGLRLPPAFTDVFDAMDTFPEDTADAVGGDGKIRFLDWQILLDRSLRFRTNNWTRTWVNGQRTPARASLAGAALLPADSSDATPRVEISVLRPDAEISAGLIDNARPGAVVDVPVAVNVPPPGGLRGLQFRAAVAPEGQAPGLEQPVSFVASSSLPSPLTPPTLSPGETAAAWSVVANPFTGPLTGQHQLGVVRVAIPAGAKPGDAYRITLHNADGAPDLSTPYEFRALSGAVAVAGRATVTRGQDFRLRWWGVGGRQYVVDATTDLVRGRWTPVASELIGRGRYLDFVDQNSPGETKFYRVRLLP